MTKIKMTPELEDALKAFQPAIFGTGALNKTISQGAEDPTRRWAEFTMRWEGDGSISKCQAFSKALDALNKAIDNAKQEGAG